MQTALDFDRPAAPDWQAERDAGMQKAADHAERDEPGFGKRAYQFLVSYAADHAEFGGEDAVLAAKAAGIVPDDDRAFGSVFARAVRANIIRRNGYVARKRGHGAPGPLWLVVR